MVSGHTITDKKIEELAKEVANLKNEKLTELAVSAADEAKPVAAIKFDDNLVFESKLAPSTAYVNDYAIATIADVAAKANVIDVTALASRVDELENMHKTKIVNNNKEKKEMKGFNFDFGKITGDSVRMSVYGVAVKNNSGTWVAYDSKTESMMDVDVLSFSGADMLYKMPVAVNQVKAGDVVIHNRKPCFVVSFSEDGTAFSVVDIMDSEQKMILPVKSPFGFSFVTKVVSPFNFAGSADAQNPFGNMLPLMMMGDKDIDPMVLMMMCGNGGFDMSNPMMMMLLLDDKGDKSDMMKTMLMAQMFANQNK